MNKSNNIDLTNLVKEAGKPCISIYMPTHPAGGMSEEDSLTLKNLVRESREQMKANSIRQDTIHSFMEPVEQLIDDNYFWRYQDRGLVIFRSPDYFDSFHIPIEVEKMVYVDDDYYLKPLLPLFNGEGNFYLLLLSQNNVKLYQGNRYNLEEVNVPGMPAGLQNITKFDVEEKQLQMHTPRPQKTGSDVPVYHGQGTTGDDDKLKKKLRPFIKEIDKHVQKELKHEKDKLILSGVAYLQAMFRELNSYPHLHEEGLEGNVDKWPLKDLHEKSWKIMQKVIDTSLAAELENFRQVEGSEQTSQDIKNILPAAYRGRVRTLFVARNMYQWGRFSPETGEVRLQLEHSKHTKDMLDKAAVFTIMGRGQVYAIPNEIMPHQTHIAAIYRY